jgi:hypothetical protein
MEGRQPTGLIRLKYDQAAEFTCTYHEIRAAFWARAAGIPETPCISFDLCAV